MQVRNVGCLGNRLTAKDRSLAVAARWRAFGLHFYWTHSRRTPEAPPADTETVSCGSNKRAMLGCLSYLFRTYFTRAALSREIVSDTLPRFVAFRLSGGSAGFCVIVNAAHRAAPFASNPCR